MKTGLGRGVAWSSICATALFFSSSVRAQDAQELAGGGGVGGEHRPVLPAVGCRGDVKPVGLRGADDGPAVWREQERSAVARCLEYCLAGGGEVTAGRGRTDEPFLKRAV